MRVFSFIVGILVFSTSISQAQTVYTPSENSKERKNIINALKRQIIADGETKAIVNAHYLKVSRGWAYLAGIPKRNATQEQELYNVKALLKESNGKWAVVKYLVGSDDFATFDWSAEFHAPKAIFPKWVRGRLC